MKWHLTGHNPFHYISSIFESSYIETHQKQKKDGPFWNDCRRVCFYSNATSCAHRDGELAITIVGCTTWYTVWCIESNEMSYAHSLCAFQPKRAKYIGLDSLPPAAPLHQIQTHDSHRRFYPLLSRTQRRPSLMYTHTRHTYDASKNILYACLFYLFVFPFEIHVCPNINLILFRFCCPVCCTVRGVLWRTAMVAMRAV